MQSSSSQRSIPILDRPLRNNKTEVSHSAFAFLFSEMVQYAYNRISSIDDLSLRLEELGFGVGQRLIELIGCRDRVIKRETRIVGILQYITTTMWKQVFNKNADTLERAMEDEDEYMIHESNPITNTFVSVPSDLGQLDCAAYIAGIIRGMLDSAKFVSTLLYMNYRRLLRSPFDILLIVFSSI